MKLSFTYVRGFFTASAFQVLVVSLALAMNVSNFDPNFTVFRLFFHFTIGQLAGFGYAYLMQGVENPTLVLWYGVSVGILFWALVIAYLGPLVGYIPSVLALGVNETLTTIVAFLGFGYIIGRTELVKRTEIIH